METRYLDDLAPGDRFGSGEAVLSEEEVLAFARAYDPQPFHLDPEAAARTPYGGIIASGFQTIALGFRVFIEQGLLRDSSLGSPGLDELRWKAPVRPGDTLRTEVEVLEVRPSASRPDRGIARMRYGIHNQHGEEVASFVALHLLRRRTPA